VLSLNGLSKGDVFEGLYEPPLGLGLAGIVVIITRDIELSSITLVTLGSLYIFRLLPPINPFRFTCKIYFLCCREITLNCNNYKNISVSYLITTFPTYLLLFPIISTR
jgi:hypothetical protein